MYAAGLRGAGAPLEDHVRPAPARVNGRGAVHPPAHWTCADSKPMRPTAGRPPLVDERGRIFTLAVPNSRGDARGIVEIGGWRVGDALGSLETKRPGWKPLAKCVTVTSRQLGGGAPAG